MRRIALGVAFAATMLAGGAHADDWSWLSFSKVNQSMAGHFRVEVGVGRRDGRGIWIAKRVEQPAEKGAQEQTTWAASDTCPAMMPAFAKLTSIEPFTIVPPGFPHEGASTADGAIFRVHVLGYWAQANHDGEILLSGNYGTPVADWVQETMKALAPCWSEQRPGA